jgi:hypothetical protein
MRPSATVGTALLLSLALLSPASPSASGEPRLAPVYLGGVTADMRNLADPARTAQFRAAGGGFYAHESYVLLQSHGECPSQIASAIGFGTPLAVDRLIRCNYHGIGLYPALALVNLDLATTTEAAWRDFVEAARSAGVRRLAPLISPNLPSDPRDWSDPYWDRPKRLALAGGALAMDTPPLLYRILGQGYVRFARQQLEWCARSGIPCIDIISPANGEAHFPADSVAWARKITVGGVGPAAWVLENYVDGSTPSIGGDREPGTVAYGALVLARLRPVARGGPP